MAGRAAGGGDRGVRQAEVRAVHHEQAEVGQRVAERRHLPVEDGPDPVVGADQGVVQAIVAVYDGGRGGGGQFPAERGVQFVDAGQLAVAGGVQLLAPAAQLPVEEALGAPEVAQADGPRVHGVQFDERVDEAEDGRPGALGAQRRELFGRAVRGALDVLHDVEGRPDHRVVLAEQHGLGYRNGCRVQGADHPVLALHVVRGGQHMTQRGPADDPAPRAVRDDVRQVRAAALDEPGFERSVHQTRPLAVEMAAQPVEVETWRVDWAHRAHLRGEKRSVFMMPTSRYVVQWTPGIRHAHSARTWSGSLASSRIPEYGSCRKPELLIAEVRLTPVLIADPPLLNTQGVHQPYTPRLIVEVVTRGGVTGVEETYGDGTHLELAEPLAVALVGRPVSERNHDHVRQLGAQPVAYGDGLADRLRALAPDGVDAAFDTVGGEALRVSADLLKPGAGRPPSRTVRCSRTAAATPTYVRTPRTSPTWRN